MSQTRTNIHGEFVSWQATSNLGLFQQSFNTILVDSTSGNGANGTNLTGNVVLFSEIGKTINTATVDHNVMVSNLNSGQQTSAYLGVVDAQPSTTGGTISKLLWDSNYLDPTGSIGPFGLTGTVTRQDEIFRANKNMLDGSIVGAYS